MTIATTNRRKKSIAVGCVVALLLLAVAAAIEVLVAWLIVWLLCSITGAVLQWQMVFLCWLVIVILHGLFNSGGSK